MRWNFAAIVPSDLGGPCRLGQAGEYVKLVLGHVPVYGCRRVVISMGGLLSQMGVSPASDGKPIFQSNATVVHAEYHAVAGFCRLQIVVENVPDAHPFVTGGGVDEVQPVRIMTVDGQATDMASIHFHYNKFPKLAVNPRAIRWLCRVRVVLLRPVPCFFMLECSEDHSRLLYLSLGYL